METVRHYSNNQEATILEHLPFADTTDTVLIEIARSSDTYYWDFAAEDWVDTPVSGTTGTMDLFAGSFGNITRWKSSFTPTSTDTYSIVCYDETKDMSYPIVATSSGESTSSGSSSEYAGSDSLTVLWQKARERLGLTFRDSLPSELDDEDAEIISVFNDKIQEYACDGSMWTPLEETGVLVLVEGQTSYDIPTDMFKFDEETFQLYADDTATTSTKDIEFGGRKIQNLYLGNSPSEIYYIFERGDQLVINKAPTADDAGKEIRFTYYKIPAEVSIDKPNESTWFPTPFARTVLVESVVAEMFIRRQKSNASTSYAKVDGDRTGNMALLGSISRMRARYAPKGYFTQLQVKGL